MVIEAGTIPTKRIELYGGAGHVEYVQHMGDDLTIVNAARVSFGKHKEEMDAKDEKLVKYLAKHRHTSTFEHNVVTFRIKVPLYVRSQHHRHRTWSYNEVSRRYTEENIQFYEPEAFRTQHKSNRQASNEEELINPKVNFMWDESTSGYNAVQAMKEFHEGALYLYESLLEAGVCREQARGVLPQNMMTEYYGTCNLSNLIKFIDLRLDSHAQKEIQVVAQAMLDIATDLWPIAVGAYKNSKGE